MTICPCCQQPVETDRPIVDMTNNRISHGEHVLDLTCREAELMIVLTRKMPSTADWDLMISSVYGSDEPEDAARTLQVFASKLRPRLKPMGLNIVTVWGVGYRLEMAA